MTKDEARAIAAAVHHTRAEWGEAGIMAVLARIADRDATSVRTAALAAATTRADQHTPAVIALDGPHWDGTRYGRHPAAPPAPTGPRCEVCGRTRDAHDRADARVPEDMRHAWLTKAEHHALARTINRRTLTQAAQPQLAA